MSLPDIATTHEETVNRHAAVLRRTAANAVSLLFAYLLPRLLTFGAAVVAARVLGAGGFGAYGVAAALAVILSIVTTLGMMPLLIRSIARRPDSAPSLIGAAHVVKTAANVVMLTALFALARWVLAYPAEVVTATMLLGLAYAIGSYGESLGAYFQGIERMQIWMQANAVFGVVTGILGVMLVVTTASVEMFCLAPVCGQLGAVAWLLKRTPSNQRLGTVRAEEVRLLLKTLVPFAVGFIVLTMYYKIDVLLLARWRSASDVGVYAAAYKFVDVAQALAVVGVSALYPRLARIHATATDVGSLTTRRLTELVVLSVVPAAGVLWLVRSPVVQLLFDTPYLEAVGVLALLAPALPALAINILMGFNFAAAERMWLVASVYAGGLLANVALNAVFIPVLGPRGAALAMLLSEAGVAVVFLVAAGTVLGAVPHWRPVLIAAASAAMCIAFHPFARLLGPVGAAGIYMLAVAVVYRGVGVLHPKEWDAVRHMVLSGRAAPARLRWRVDR